MTKQEKNEKIIKTIKALTKKDEIKLETVDIDDNFFTQNQNLNHKNLFNIPKTQNLSDLRALSDLASCYSLFHDPKTHQNTKNNHNFGEFEHKIIDNFEKIRLLGKANEIYRGVVKNNLEKISNDINFSIIDQNCENFQLILLDFIFKNRKNDLFPAKLAESLQIIKQHFKPEIIEKIAEIAQDYQNQEAFSLKTAEFLDFLHKNQQSNQKKQEKSPKPQEAPSQNQENIEKSTPKQENPDKNKQKDQESPPQEPQKQETPTDIKPGNTEQVKALNIPTKPNEEGVEFKNLYQFFTNKFDEIILPQKLIDANELEVLRLNLDSKLENLDKISKRLTLKLKQKLIAKQNFTIQQSEDEGILDRKKLTQIVLNPFEKNFFIKQKHHEYQDTIVTILLDNSGSMRGGPIIMAALACEIIASILQNFTIKTEILGFTTADWRGGKARKMWERNEKPQNPGRLNDLRHIIYKSANQNFKKARNNLGLMLKEGILKENIDGEALLWAKSRLMQREENRKILMIISDGTPVDDSTNSVNDEEILVDHLRHVIKNIEKQGKIELIGVGIGHNVGDFYQNSISIKNIEELGDVMIEKLIDLL